MRGDLLPEIVEDLGGVDALLLHPVCHRRVFVLMTSMNHDQAEKQVVGGKKPGPLFGDYVYTGTCRL